MRTWLYDTVRSVSESFGYQEWDAPFLETLDLYAAKSGEELVKKQSYVFTDRGGDEITLRPELTPSLARMIAADRTNWSFPCAGGRLDRSGGTKDPVAAARENFSNGISTCWVSTSPEADAELVAIAAAFLKAVGLTPTQAHICVNNRRFMDAEFDTAGILPEKKAEVSGLVDRREKMEAGSLGSQRPGDRSDTKAAGWTEIHPGRP